MALTNKPLSPSLLVQHPLTMRSAPKPYYLLGCHRSINKWRSPDLLALGKHCHNCGKWMQRRALRKDDNFNYCECCGLETIRQLRINKARALSNLFRKKQKAASVASQDLFDDFQVHNEELMLIEDSLMIDDASSDNKKKQLLSVSSDDASSDKEKQLLSVSSDFISLEEQEKENILNGGQTPEET
ncbi:hypothetical protein EVAR_33155_1 [Eumeta japonica]|uniref:Uncharacterized protein n=1 Tax=Eumeta variegata TaxID=151549 RepID=A0A4C1ZYP3_EUMVA|nr:hypothetical protein EVAR_33155_1 [Eumeta japonica]